MGSKTTIYLRDPETGASTGETITEDTRSLAEAKLEAKARLADHIAAKLAEGFAFAGKVIQIDDMSVRNINAQASVAMVCVLTGAAWPDDFGWITADNSIMPITTPQAMMAFGTASAAFVAALIFANRDHKDAIEALTDHDACDAYDVTTSWPN